MTAISKDRVEYSVISRPGDQAHVGRTKNVCNCTTTLAFFVTHIFYDHPALLALGFIREFLPFWGNTEWSQHNVWRNLVKIYSKNDVINYLYDTSEIFVHNTIQGKLCTWKKRCSTTIKLIRRFKLQIHLHLFWRMT